MATVRDRLLCLLGDRRYSVELDAYQRGTIDATRSLVDQQAEANDGTLTPTAAWKRTIDNFTGGAGQTWADLEESERNQHRSSVGLVPFQYRSLRLSREARTVVADSVTTANHGPMALVPGPGGLEVYYIGGPILADRLAYTTDMMTWPSGAVTHGATGVPVEMTTDGTFVYYAFPIAAIKVDPATKTSAAMGGGFDNYVAIEYASGRLVALSATTGSLVEWDSAGTRSVALTHWAGANANPVRRGLVGLSNAIYAAFTPGGAFTSEIYAIVADDTTTALTDGKIALRMPNGEVIVGMAGGPGYLVISTNLGIRLAMVGNDGDLSLGPLFIETAGTKTGPSASGLTMAAPMVFGSKVFIGVGKDPAGELDDAQYLAVADLTRFIAELTPAWQLVANLDPSYVAGFFGDDRISGGIAFQDPLGRIETLSGFLFLGGASVWALDVPDLIEEGKFFSGRYTFGTPEPKRVQSVEVEHNMAEDTAVDVAINTPEGRVELGVITYEAGVSSTRFDLPTGVATRVDWVEVELTLHRSTSDSEVGPEVQRITIRAVPLPDRVDEIYLPIKLNRRVSLSGGEMGQATFAPWEEYSYLRDLMLRRETIRYEMGNEVLAVMIDGLYYDGSDPNTKINGWSNDRSWLDGVLVVKLQTLPGVEVPPAPANEALATEEPDELLTEHGDELMGEP
jgi:hypothetical protein